MNPLAHNTVQLYRNGTIGLQANFACVNTAQTAKNLMRIFQSLMRKKKKSAGAGATRRNQTASVRAQTVSAAATRVMMTDLTTDLMRIITMS